MKLPPYLFLILATILWGGNFVIGRAVSGEIPPITLALFRWCVAFLVFFPIAYKQVKADIHKFKNNWKVVLVLSITGVACFNTLVYIGVHYTTSINASLMNSLTPIFIYILAFLFLKSRVTQLQLVGTFLSIIGVLFILSGGKIENIIHFSFNVGDLIVLVAVLCWSIYSLLIKQYANELPNFSTFLITIVVGAILLLPFSIMELSTTTETIHWSIKSISAILYVGILASIVAFLSWNYGVVQMGAEKASIFLNFIPVFSSIFATIFLHEQLMLAQIIGGLAVIGGVIIANYTKKEKRV